MNIIGYLIGAAVINLAAVALFVRGVQRPAMKPVPVRVRRDPRRG